MSFEEADFTREELLNIVTIPDTNIPFFSLR